MEPMIFDIDNVSGTWDDDMLGKRWVMLEDGLTCLDCTDIKGINSDELDELSSEVSSDEDASEMTATFRFPQLLTYFINSLI